MDGVNLENDVKFQIHEPFELVIIFDRIIEENVLMRYMTFLQEWQPFIKNQMTFPMKLLR